MIYTSHILCWIVFGSYALCEILIAAAKGNGK
jgi:hypothetical protein